MVNSGSQFQAVVGVDTHLDSHTAVMCDSGGRQLAAARVRALTVEQIAARLDDRFGLLTTGDRSAAPRQRTLRDAIEWSYDLLTEPERALFRRLAGDHGPAERIELETTLIARGSGEIPP